MWMERLMDRLDLLAERFEKAEKKRSTIDGEELLDNQDLMLTFKISARSLQRYRSEGKLPYYTISGKIYYKLSDVHQFIREHFSIPVKAKKDNQSQNNTIVLDSYLQLLFSFYNLKFNELKPSKLIYYG